MHAHAGPRSGPEPSPARSPDRDAVKAAAAGRWGEILPALAGLPADALDGRNRPCPWCGEGDDRFNADRRTFSVEGRVHCNRCPFHGDGFAAVMKWNGCGFGDALALVADFLNVAAADGPRHVRRSRRTVRPRRRSAGKPPGEWAAVAADTARDILTDGRLERLSDLLGLPAEALAAAGAGWCRRRGVYTFPMREPGGAVVGVRTREPSGRKAAFAGSDGHGLFMPSAWADAPPDRPGRLVVCEGTTDAAAFAAWGLPAVGRPAARCGFRYVDEVVGRVRPGEVAILADADDHGEGLRSARSLAAVLRVRVPVRVAEPPSGVKDARDWFRRGADAGEVVDVLNAAPLLPVPVRRVSRGGRR